MKIDKTQDFPDLLQSMKKSDLSCLLEKEDQTLNRQPVTVNETITKRGPGRPRKYFTEEEIRDAERRKHKKFMDKSVWYCDICGNGHNYRLRGKHTHLSTRKHQINAQKTL